jgi:hypothetical protein
VIAQAKQKTSAKDPLPVTLSLISQHSPTPVPNSRYLTAVHSPTLSTTIPLASFNSLNKENKLAVRICPLSMTKWQTKKNGQHPAAKTPLTTTTNKDRVNGANKEGDDGNQVDPPIHLEPGSLQLPPPVFSPHLCRTLTQKHKQDCIDIDVSDDLFLCIFIVELELTFVKKAHSSADATRPQTKKNQTNDETNSCSIDNSDEHAHTSPRSPQFGTLLLLKSTMAQNNSMSHPHSSHPIPVGPMAIEEDTNGEVTVGLTHPSSPCILFKPTTESDDSDDEITIGLDSTHHPPVNHHTPFEPMIDTDDGIIGSLPNTVGLSHESQQNKPPFSIVPVHYMSGQHCHQGHKQKEKRY